MCSTTTLVPSAKLTEFEPPLAPLIPGVGTSRNDVAVNFDDSVARLGGHIREMGDLEGVVALDTMNLAGKFLHATPDALTITGGTKWLQLGAPARFIIRESADPASKEVGRLP